ncbi:carboxylesterase/lipase family protein [Sphingomonas alpina]|uniref:Carboxylic ester hydrolase n=1 Tax=Sphingomonas alpina TaxID=653931 RepID=A0A7H0LFM0_9SPHN|nr:carboxylesterase family protein [Sphingomonas alpina]QNQ08473.1 carboxylesterase family protein [Sphingomonas alpina]
MQGTGLLVGLIALAAAHATATPALAQAKADAPEVRIDSGMLRGERSGDLTVFKGIPYAAPPVGDRRWRTPAPAAAWPGMREADKFGTDCEQTRRDWDAARAKEPKGEDCLFLNVWAPAGAKRAPVMVWIHGGSFTAGSAAQSVYDGRHLAERGVVIVTFNYRLGRFGFFAHPALTAEAGTGPTGNWGLMDQIAALNWVKRNITAFGGDPSNVTIFGESAGGGSVNQLMVTPAARGLFHRAIAQSGGGRDHPPTLAEAEAKGTAFATGAGATAQDVAALRAIPVDTVRGNMSLLNTEAATYSGPLVDGRIVTGNPDAIFLAGRQAAVPYLVGANSDEVAFAPAAMRAPITAMFSAQLGPDLAAVKAAYGTPEAFDRNVVGDAMFTEPARYMAGLTARNRSYLYNFDYVPEGKRATVKGAAHASELPFVFGTLDELGVAVTDADRKTAKAMGDYWVAFARGGTPNAPGLPAWSRFAPGTGPIMVFAAEGPVSRSSASPALDALAKVADAKRDKGK